MKSGLAVLTLVLSLLFWPCQAPRAAEEQPSKDSSLEETYKWLADKITSSAGWTTDSEQETQEFKYKVVKTAGSTFTFEARLTRRQKDKGGRAGKTSVTTFVLPLEMMNSDVRVEKSVHYEAHNVLLSTLDNKAVIKRRWGYKWDVEEADSTRTSIGFTDQELAKRVAQVFRHAIELCKERERNKSDK